ncbi:12843_t:CDS:2, partial [Funneliformis geosporum]
MTNIVYQADISGSSILVNPSTTSAITSGMETPSDEHLRKEQCGQQDDENIPEFQATESLSNKSKEHNKSKNIIPTGRNQLITTVFDNIINNSQINKSKDLVESIPGLYRLLYLYKDEESNGFANKTIISKDFLKKLCDDMAPS